MTDELQPLVQALARVHGSLSEIATVWRRVAPDRPDLPLALPVRLAEAVHSLTESVTSDPAGLAGLAGLAGRLAELERELAAAAALTSGPDAPAAGDAGLWEYARAALGQVRELVLGLSRWPLAS